MLLLLIITCLLQFLCSALIYLCILIEIFTVPFFSLYLMAGFYFDGVAVISSAGEIDRCLKKVGEGVEQFEDIWQKVSKDRRTDPVVVCPKLLLTRVLNSLKRLFCFRFSFPQMKNGTLKVPSRRLTLFFPLCSSTMQQTQTRRRNMKPTSRKRLKSCR